MENNEGTKRLKLSNGSAIKKSPGKTGAAHLPAYRPPAAVGAGGASSPQSSNRPSASIARPANGKTSLRLTVKAAPSKLRQATSGSQVGASIPPNPYADNASESDATPIPVGRAARPTRNPRTVVEPESEEEEDEDEEEDAEGEEDEEIEDEEAGEDEDQELEGDEDSMEDAEGEEEQDEDEEMEDADEDAHPPPPIIKTTNPLAKNRPNVTVTAPPEGPLKSVEDKEMDDEEDEELSELDSNENENEEEEDEEAEDSDEDDDSRAATPDLSKLTRRQRGFYDEPVPGELLSLSNEAQKKKELTEEEHAMRRAEMARRRKNLSEKRNEEEKMDTINKLLKKPAPKRRTRAEIIAQQQADSMATPGAEEGEEDRADPLFVRYVQNRNGAKLGVPDEWMELDGSLGEVLRVGWNGGGGNRMVEEVA